MNIIRIISGLLHFDRTNWKAVSLCVLAASVFWIFNAFNKNHSTNIQFPVTFEFNHEKFAPLHSLPNRVNLNVTGNGWDLFTKNLGFKVPHLLVQLDKPADTKKIIASSLLPTFAGQIGALHINHVLTDTFKIQIDVRDRHKFKLVADLSKATFEKGFGRTSPIVVLPDSVFVDGPQSLLHQLPDSIRLAVNESGINSNYKSDLEIEIKSKDFVARNPVTAKVIFEVGRVEDVEKKIALKRKGKFTGDSLLAWFQIPIDKVSDFNSSSKEIVALEQRSSVRVSRLPRYALLVKTDSIIRKNKK